LNGLTSIPAYLLGLFTAGSAQHCGSHLHATKAGSAHFVMPCMLCLASWCGITDAAQISAASTIGFEVAVAADQRSAIGVCVKTLDMALRALLSPTCQLLLCQTLAVLPLM